MRAIDADFTLGSHLSARDEKAVRKTVSGLLKILHPHGEWSHGDLREYLEFALEGRRRVKEQLKKLAPHDYAKTAFSYIENDTGREVWVEVPEQPDELDTEPEVDVAEVEDEQRRTTAELIAAGESKTRRVQADARGYNEHTEQVDKKLEHAVVKSVAGFLNAGGGVLLIGVHDDQKPTGYGRRLLDHREQRPRRFRELAHHPARPGDRQVADGYSRRRYASTSSHGATCAVSTCGPSRSPCIPATIAEFYVRMGNSTRPYNTRDAMEYIRSRW